MYKILFISVLLVNFFIQGYSQNNEIMDLGIPVFLKTEMGKLSGTVLVPENSSPSPIVLIIAGSGPTDRDGNNPVMKNNSLKMIAESLLENGIASLRYDKRGIGESKDAGKEESDLRLGDYISDAVGWINMLKKDKRFDKIIVIGHSEGSLIGMIAAKEAGAYAFITVAGTGKRADILLKEQLKGQPEFVRNISDPILDSLSEGFQVKNVNPMLNSLFRPSVQPYLISWFQYDPVTEIGKLTIPVLIVQGTTDIQVSVEDAKMLAEANKKSELIIVDGMNHVLKDAVIDREKNIATYNNPDLPLNQQFSEAIIDFINNFQK